MAELLEVQPWYSANLGRKNACGDAKTVVKRDNAS